ncbi:hypothetical protein FACS189411_09690 [Bacteroidia bacterium]|nr:hypothetical protein FACS189411_09690 [Bacteroidia bacterium]
MMHKANYSTNLTEKQLQVIEKLLENKTRMRKHSIAEIINYLLLVENRLSMAYVTSEFSQVAISLLLLQQMEKRGSI